MVGWVGARCQTGIRVRVIGALFGASRDKQPSQTQPSGGAEAMRPWDDTAHRNTRPSTVNALLDLGEAAGAVWLSVDMGSYERPAEGGHTDSDVGGAGMRG